MQRPQQLRKTVKTGGDVLGLFLCGIGATGYLDIQVNAVLPQCGQGLPTDAPAIGRHKIDADRRQTGIAEHGGSNERAPYQVR